MGALTSLPRPGDMSVTQAIGRPPDTHSGVCHTCVLACVGGGAVVVVPGAGFEFLEAGSNK